jgi:prophage antirepressor-like protein
MNQELMIRQFKNQNIRLFQDNQGGTWFCLKDVCDTLDIKNSRHVLSRIQSKDVATNDTPTDGGVQALTYVSEAGLWDAILDSRKPIAKEFRYWVVSEVLPSIRKTGTYSVTPKPDLSIDLIIALATEQKRFQEHTNQRLQAVEQTQRAVVAVLEPVQQITPRKQISQIVRTFANKYKLDYESCFNGLYREYKYRNGIDLKERARNAKSSPMQIAEELGKINELLSLSVYLFIEDNFVK